MKVLKVVVPLIVLLLALSAVSFKYDLLTKGHIIDCLQMLVCVCVFGTLAHFADSIAVSKIN